MFGFGKKKETPPTEPAVPAVLSEETGYQGSPDSVAEGARWMPGDYDKKVPLLKGAMRAFREGRPENLRAFLGSYLAFKSALGSFISIDKKDMDEGTTTLIATPVVQLLEESATPAETVATIAVDLPPYYAQILLDVSLRYACRQNSFYAVEALLETGADVNSYSGRALLIACGKNNQRIGAILLRYAPDIGLTRREQYNANAPEALAKFDAFIANAKIYPLPESKAGLKLPGGDTPVAQQTPALGGSATAVDKPRAIRKGGPKPLDI